MMRHRGGRALCHDWLTTYGGADQVAARLADALDINDIFAYAVRPSTAAELFPSRTVARIGPGRAQHHWQWFLPFMPSAWRSLDLDSYDLVVTSSHSCVNSVRPREDAVHVSYCHTPMRYAWAWRTELQRFPPIARPGWRIAAALLRRADRRWSQRVDLFLANSRYVAHRIATAYAKPSLVVHPPIDTSYWTPGGSKKDYFLVSGRLVAYKRPDLAVEAVKAAGLPLVIAGDGPLLPSLERAATHAVVVKNPSRDELRELYRGARGYVFAGIEDFGMSIVEAQACGTPVIALAEGGALETVLPGESGILVDSPSVSAFAAAIEATASGSSDIDGARRSAMRFDADRFDEKVSWTVERALERDWPAIHDHPDWMEA